LLNTGLWIKTAISFPVEYPRQKPLPAGAVLKDTIRVTTLDLAGENSLWIEINPDKDQPEQHHFNNMGKLPFTIISDNTNPVLDVTFDGIRIMDKDIVSAKPLIRIILKDENQFMALNDTTLIKVFIQYPGETIPRRIYFQDQGQQQMLFFEASMPANTCIVEYQPEFSSDGTYRLLIQATDRSGNESGKEDYSIHFQVINRSTITEVMNWPNPFSSATHFVFTLTGSELPTFFRIQIMTITGKVVREIDMSELGPVNIGRNITRFAWDGTDSHGDRLANGVYLYRVITNINEKPIEINPTQASRFFHKEFGKMYLIR
jgi:hypothetical protein